MKHIIVDPFLFEVAREIDQDISTNVEVLLSLDTKQRLVAAITALQVAGFAQSRSYHREIWMTFTKVAVRKMQLQEFSLSRRAKSVALTPRFRFVLQLPDDEFARAIDLSNRYAAQLNHALVGQSWRNVGTLVGHTAKGDFRLIGPEANNGLVFEALTRSAQDQIGGKYFWFSLGKRPRGEPDPIDLEQDVEALAGADEIIIKWPIKRVESL